MQDKPNAIRLPPLISLSTGHVQQQLGMAPDLEALLHKSATTRVVTAGERIFLQDGPFPGLIGVISGAVRFSVSGHQGRDFLLGQMPAGHWFGHQQSLDGMANPCDATAVIDSRLAVIPTGRLEALMAEHPRLLKEFARILSVRTRMLLLWSVNMASAPFEKRLANLLVSLMTVDESGTNRISLVQDDIASHLGVSRQTVNRQLKIWESQGWMAIHYGTITVHDANRLMSAGA